MDKFHPTSLYAADGQAYTCLSAAERDELAARGWVDTPQTPTLTWRARFDQIEHAEAVVVETNPVVEFDEPPKRKPGRPKKGE